MPHLRITLINASLRESRAYCVPDGFAEGFEKVIRPYQPLGILSLAAVLIKDGFNDIQVLDPDVGGLPRSEVVRKVKKFSPDIIGLSCMSFTYLYCLNLAKELKKQLDCPITIGGTHVSLYPKEVMIHDAFDVGVIADGEFPFRDIVRCLARSANKASFFRGLHHVSGIVFKEKCSIKLSPERPIFTNLDSLPFPAYNLLDIRNYDQDYLPNPTATIITARGCPMKCSYCSRSHWDRVDRFHSPQYIVDQMEAVVESTGAQSFFILDDTFTYHKRRVMKICALIRERGLDLNFSALTRVTHIDNEVAEALTKAGISSLSLGVESGDQMILNKLQKGQTVRQIRDAFKICHRFNFHTLAYFLIGHPDETEEQIENTIRLIKEIKPEWFKANILIPYPGTKLYADLVGAGMIDDFWKRMTLEGRPINAPNISQHLTLKELESYRSKINLMPYTRLRGNNLLKLTKIKGWRNLAISLGWITRCGLEKMRNLP